MDEKVIHGKSCSICGKEQVVASCVRCGSPVCEHCACYETESSGCCFAWPAYTCPACAGRSRH